MEDWRREFMRLFDVVGEFEVVLFASFLVFGRSFGNALSFDLARGSLSSFRVTRWAFGLGLVPNFDRFLAGTLDCLGCHNRG